MKHIKKKYDYMDSLNRYEDFQNIYKKYLINIIYLTLFISGDDGLSIYVLHLKLIQLKPLSHICHFGVYLYSKRIYN